jgi:hypothetical protein
MNALLRSLLHAGRAFIVLMGIAWFCVMQTASGENEISPLKVSIDNPDLLPPYWEIRTGILGNVQARWDRSKPVLLRVCKNFTGSSNCIVDVSIEKTPQELTQESLGAFLEALIIKLRPTEKIILKEGGDITSMLSEKIYASGEIKIHGLRTYLIGTKTELNCAKTNYYNIEIKEGIWAWVTAKINNDMVGDGEDNTSCNPSREKQLYLETLQVVGLLGFGINSTVDRGSTGRPSGDAKLSRPNLLARIGLIPGPHSNIEAIVGVLAPGLIAIFGGLLGGTFGPAPLSVKRQDGTPATADGLPDGGIADASPDSADTPNIEWTSPDGRTYVLEKQADGRYRNNLTGGMLDPDRVEEWKQTTSATEREQRALGQGEMDKMSRGDTAFDRDLQALKDKAAERDKLFSNLSTMEKGILFGSGGAADLYRSAGAPGSMIDQVRNLREQLTQGREFNKNQYDRVAQVYRDAQAGRILSERHLPTSSQITRDAVSDAVNATVDEVLTGQTADGATSWKGMITRGLLDIATGGTSEIVLTSASALKTMKNYVDKGGDSVLDGFREAVGEVLVNELSDRVFDKALSTVGHGTQKVLNPIGESLSTAGKTVPPVGRIAGAPGTARQPADFRSVGSAKTPPAHAEIKAPGAPKTNAAELIKEGMTKGPDGALRAKKSDVLEIMRDPQKVRDLKNAPLEIQQAFETTRQHIYEGHDMNLENYVRTKVPGMANKEVRVMDFRTPGKDGKLSINTDRDYRVCYKDVHPKTGEEMWIEVDRQYWEKESYRCFAEETGGPGYPPEAAKHWAEQHQQLGTDKCHAEASPDFSDQAMMFIENPKMPGVGHWEKVQIEPNINWVRQGKATLIAPETMGTMYQTKVGDAMQQGIPTTEAFVQAGKAVTELEAVRWGYSRQDYEIGTFKPDLRTGIDIVSNAARKGSDPSVGAIADAQLRAAGYEGGLPEFMVKISEQFESLKWAKRG